MKNNSSAIMISLGQICAEMKETDHKQIASEMESVLKSLNVITLTEMKAEMLWRNEKSHILYLSETAHQQRENAYFVNSAKSLISFEC